MTDRPTPPDTDYLTLAQAEDLVRKRDENLMRQAEDMIREARAEWQAGLELQIKSAQSLWAAELADKIFEFPIPKHFSRAEATAFSFACIEIGTMVRDLANIPTDDKLN